MKKSIAFILPHFYSDYRGGAETQCYYLAKELLSRGWEVHYIHESVDNKQNEIYEGIILHQLPKRKGYLKWLNYSALKQLMQEIKVDFWYSRANISYLFPLVNHSKKVGGKVIWAFSRDSQFYYNDKDQRKASPIIKLFNFLNQALFFEALKKTDFILLQTQQQKTLLKNHRNLEGEVIYNAHPIHQNTRNDGDRKPQILWIGRMRQFKRPDRLVKLAELLKEDGFQIFAIGKNSNDNISELLKQCEKENPIFKLLGEKPPQEVHNHLLESKLLINTSEFEGFSNTFIEAWLRGVPVFSFQVDPDQMITQNGLGIVENDAKKLKNEIVKLLHDQDKWLELSQKCSLHALNNFDIKNAVNQLEKRIIAK